MNQTMMVVSQWFVPVLLVLVVSIGYWRRVKVLEVFIDGAKGSLAVAASVFPYLLGMLVAIAVLRASGFLDFLAVVLDPVVTPLGIPQEVLPMALLRPISGSGALGMLTEVLNQYGPDGMIGRIASTMQGSTETTLYVLAVYFGSVGIFRYRHALWVGLLADLTAFVVAVWLCRLVF